MIAERVAAAMKRRASIRPTVLSTPITVDVHFKSYRPAEVLSYLPIVERIDSHGIRYSGKDILDAAKFIEFITTYTIELEP